MLCLGRTHANHQLAPERKKLAGSSQEAGSKARDRGIFGDCLKRACSFQVAELFQHASEQLRGDHELFLESCKSAGNHCNVKSNIFQHASEHIRGDRTLFLELLLDSSEIQAKEFFQHASQQLRGDLDILVETLKKVPFYFRDDVFKHVPELHVSADHFCEALKLVISRTASPHCYCDFQACIRGAACDSRCGTRSRS